jgi:hypothetical protein
MKRVFTVAALLIQAGALAASAAHAQTEEPKYLRLPHRFQIFMEGGGSLPTRPDIWNDQWNAGFSFGIGAGMSIFPWLEVNGGLSAMSFSLNTLGAKTLLQYQGIEEVEGGTVSTRVFYGSARFIAVPKSRTNTYVETAFGYYKTSAEDVVIEGVLRNSMEETSGLSFAPTVGIQYALGDYWTAYTRYTYMVNVSDTFAPGELLQPAGGGRPVVAGDQVIQTISVGIMVRF